MPMLSGMGGMNPNAGAAALQPINPNAGASSPQGGLMGLLGLNRRQADAMPGMKSSKVVLYSMVNQRVRRFWRAL